MVAVHWKDNAIAKSVIITDGWEVTKAYAGRIAEPVLFVCMVANIIEILPGVNVWPAFSNVVLGTQAVTLDVAGFGLASMADHARRNGDEQAARTAERTGWCLIAIMLLTLLLVSVGLLWPSTRPYTDIGEKGLILVRVVMTVIYGHVLHGLRRIGAEQTPQPAIDIAPLEAKIGALETLLAALQEAHKNAPTSATTSTQEAPQNATQSATESDTEDDTSSAPNITLLRSKRATKGATTNTRDKASKAARYIAKNKDMSATELAQKAGISVSYARKLLSESSAQKAVNE